jgi:probable F420-dependent oxidoreductase
MTKDVKLVCGLFGLENFFPDAGIRSYINIAKEAEALGFDAVSVTDHVVMGKNLHKYPFGEFPLPSEAPWYEPLSVLNMIGSHTTSIKLATAILITPLRNPALLAKTAATIDVISNGRLELGVGLGWQREEFEAAGVDFENREEIFWETLDILKKFWSESPTSHKGKYFQFDDIWCNPKPTQGADIPLLFGIKMTSENAKKIAAVGDGWIPIKTSRPFIEDGRSILNNAFEQVKKPLPRIRGQLPTITNEQGYPDLDKTLEEFEKSFDAGLKEIEFFPINFIQSGEDIRPVLEKIAKLKGN